MYKFKVKINTFKSKIKVNNEKRFNIKAYIYSFKVVMKPVTMSYAYLNDKLRAVCGMRSGENFIKDKYISKSFLKIGRGIFAKVKDVFFYKPHSLLNKMLSKAIIKDTYCIITQLKDFICSKLSFDDKYIHNSSLKDFLLSKLNPQPNRYVINTNKVNVIMGMQVKNKEEPYVYESELNETLLKLSLLCENEEHLKDLPNALKDCVIREVI